MIDLPPGIEPADYARLLMDKQTPRATTSGVQLAASTSVAASTTSLDEAST
ncbi:hypothetical protein [Mesorhizobium sp.]|uniref:hypothetical protein n=1 Tax=Mesorhizobium sp. TaxID=1871066 RepID=UPI00257ED02D|nr:hypothetical protein [Mesorhizobium sp.]